MSNDSRDFRHPLNFLTRRADNHYYQQHALRRNAAYIKVKASIVYCLPFTWIALEPNERVKQKLKSNEAFPVLNFYNFISVYSKLNIPIYEEESLI